MCSNDPYHMYVYELPYKIRKNLCRVLDLNNTWEELGGGYMNFDVSTLNRVGQAVIRSRSPTDELLVLWGTKNHTVLELFYHLSDMQHYQAMSIIKSLVDPKHHRLIFEGEENYSKIFANDKPVCFIKEQTKHLQETNASSPHNDKDIKVSNHNVNKIPNPQEPLFKAVCTHEKKLSNVNAVINHQNQNDKDDGARAIKKTSESNATMGERLSPAINYPELEAATGRWDKRNLLGKGGFGTVYKGVWKNTHVAVKRLELQQGLNREETFKTYREQSLRELKYLNSCRHDNILPLYGYSIDGPLDCLVYQYMPNGSLEDRLLCREGTKPLTWCQRHSIATGAARGIQFLHTIGDKPLIHGDIKSANILLDPYLEPKLGDFGLAREGPVQQYTHVKVSKVHGTRPYLPDEFLRGKQFSTKVDTYSFGIVLFELATGLRAYEESQRIKFLKSRIESTSEDKLHEIKDSKAGKDDGLSFSGMITLGKTCVSLKPKDRPEMVSVLQKLDSMTLTREVVQVQPQNWVRVLTPVPMPELMHDQQSQPNSPPLPQMIPEESDVCGGLPLISELGIKSDISNPEQPPSPPK